MSLKSKTQPLFQYYTFYDKTFIEWLSVLFKFGYIQLILKYVLSKIIIVSLVVVKKKKKLELRIPFY